MKKNQVWMAALAAVLVAVPLLWGGNNYVMSLFVAGLVVSGIAVAWALLGNLGGMVSFGHAAFFGVGAYASALLTMKAGLPVLVAMPIAGLVSMFSAVLMMPALRLSGPYFALAILAYAHIFKIIVTEWKDFTGGAGGVSSIPVLPTIFGLDLSVRVGQYTVVVLLVLAFVAVYAAIRRSHYGTALRAMHDSEDATRVVGVNSTGLKSMMLLVSAFMTGVMGAFNAHTINFLEPDYAFSGSWSVLPIVAAIFGGYRTVWGPALGAIAIYLVDQLLFKNWLPTGHHIVLGVLLGAMILFAPDGLLPALRRKHKADNKGGAHAAA
ncbi:MAG: branched-chain amino acid ABC transporter permease [Aquabacterium sp.]|jgi:branched-chain amino acid transport system permease protein|uniref:branched-chain amino acid ABC transporter permease n=1 Tax=Aquabacterium sp. TaxID=1872578 RepID=UPI003BB22094